MRCELPWWRWRSWSRPWLPTDVPLHGSPAPLFIDVMAGCHSTAAADAAAAAGCRALSFALAACPCLPPSFSRWLCLVAIPVRFCGDFGETLGMPVHSTSHQLSPPPAVLLYPILLDLSRQSHTRPYLSADHLPHCPCAPLSFPCLLPAYLPASSLHPHQCTRLLLPQPNLPL
jgi:hypothetical protein